MHYKNIVSGIFIKRINRFIAEVNIEERIVRVHVKNTGRCKELFIKGRKVYLQKSNNPNRKTAYSLISIYKGDTLINIDSQVPNGVVYEAILQGEILKRVPSMLQREKTYKDSRFDFYYECEGEKGFIEVKGVTLESNGVAMFPDAPTTRGTKHVNELISGRSEGYKNYIVFLIQMNTCHLFKPCIHIDPDFSNALKKAHEHGIIIKCYTSDVTPTSIDILNEIEYVL